MVGSSSSDRAEAHASGKSEINGGLLPPLTRPDEWFKVRDKFVTSKSRRGGEMKQESGGECGHDDDSEGKRCQK